MSREEYWYGNVYIVEEYLGAYKQRMETQNWFAWLNGIYTFDAVSAVIGNVHFDKGTHKFVKPMDKPIRIFPETPEEEERRKQAAVDRFVARLNDFHAMMEAKKDAERNGECN